MYAVIQTGGKQYRVSQGSRLRVEKIEADVETTIELDRVLMVAEGDQVKVGAPYVDGGKVTAIVRGHGRAKKIKIIKFRRRKHYMKRQGHRQYYTLLEVMGISAVGISLVPETILDSPVSNAQPPDEQPVAIDANVAVIPGDATNGT